MSRRGFTLIEVLTVIIVISVLSSLLLVGGMWVITSSREASTRSTLQKVNRLIKDRETAYWEFTRDFAHGNYKAVKAKFDKEVGTASTPEEIRIQAVRDAIFGRIDAQAGSPSSPTWNERLAHTMLHIEMERVFFPQTWAEAEYLRAVHGEPAIATNPASPTENAEVLHWSLTSRSVVGTLPDDTDVITPGMVADTDGNGRKEIVDAWGKPICFWRWPARLPRPNGIPVGYRPRGCKDPLTMLEIKPNFSPISKDAEAFAGIYLPSIEPCSTDSSKSTGSVRAVLDTYNLIINSAVPDSDIIAGDCSAQVSAMEANYFLPSTYFKPIVASPGPDGEFGLLNPVSTADYGYWGKVGNVQAAYDDLTDR